MTILVFLNYPFQIVILYIAIQKFFYVLEKSLLLTKATFI